MHQENHQGDARKIDLSAATACIRDLTTILQQGHLVFKDQFETVRSIAETMRDIIGCPTTPSSTKAAAFHAMTALLHDRNGTIRQLSAMLCACFVPLLLSEGSHGSVIGSGSGTFTKMKKPTAKEVAEVRTMTWHSIAAMMDTNRNPAHEDEIEDSVAALVRNVVLQAPEKVEGRSAACEAVVAWWHLGVVEVHGQKGSSGSRRDQRLSRFLGFLCKLSRCSKPNRRVLAVDIAHALVVRYGGREGSFSMPQAPSPETSEVNNDTMKCRVEAPWGCVCLAVLLQRMSDKAPTVRARAVSHLASLLAPSSLHTMMQEGFINALVAAEYVDFTELYGAGNEAKNRKTKKPTRGGGGDDDADDDGHQTEEGEGDDEKSAIQPPPPSFLVPASLFASPPTATTTTTGLPPTALETLHRRSRVRCRDERGHVRKPAILLLQSLLLATATTTATTMVPTPPSKHNEKALGLLDEKDAMILEVATSDALVTVRKAALVAIGDLVAAAPTDATVVDLWIRSCLPLIRDVENSVQETVIDQVDELVLKKVASCCLRKRGDDDGDNPPSLPTPPTSCHNQLLPVFAALSRSGAAGKTCLARACHQLKKKGRLLGKKIALGLETVLAWMMMDRDSGDGDRGGADEVEIAGAWMLYSEIAAQAPTAPNWEFLQRQWNNTSNGATRVIINNNTADLLRVISMAAGTFPPDRAQSLCDQVFQGLESMDLSPAVAAAHISALAQLSSTTTTVGLASWAGPLLATCETCLSSAIETLRHRNRTINVEDNGNVNEDCIRRASSALFIVGEVALLRVVTPSSRVVTLVQALTSSTLASSSSDITTSFSSCTTNTASNGCGSVPIHIPHAVQALAWISLSKLCLINESLAKKCVPLFVQELHSPRSNAVVRNNIMIGLADLVINYTALVDAHIPRLASCLSDSNELVRNQALALLANLLQKDYVKWRGPLFLRIVLALVDPSPRVAAMAEYLLSDALESKLPNLAYNHFVEALFALNECYWLLGSGRALGEDRSGATTVEWNTSASCHEGDEISLKGSSPAMRAKRDRIYQYVFLFVCFVLTCILSILCTHSHTHSMVGMILCTLSCRSLIRRMAPEHKFATSARLCHELLGGVARGSLSLSEASEVVGDALRILSSKSIRVSSSKNANNIDGGEMEEEGAMAAAGAARTHLVSVMMKKHLVEAVIPVIVELRRIMEACHHPLLGDLMAAAAALLKDHKGEIENILAADRQLAKEILYDIRRAEENEKEDERLKKEAKKLQQQHKGKQRGLDDADGGGGEDGGGGATTPGPYQHQATPHSARQTNNNTPLERAAHVLSTATAARTSTRPRSSRRFSISSSASALVSPFPFSGSANTALTPQSVPRLLTPNDSKARKHQSLIVDSDSADGENDDDEYDQDHLDLNIPVSVSVDKRHLDKEEEGEENDEVQETVITRPVSQRQRRKV